MNDVVDALRAALQEIVEWNEKRGQPGAWTAHVAREALAVSPESREKEGE